MQATPDFLEKMEKYVFTEDVRLLDASAGQLGRLTLIGPKAATLLAKVMDAGLETLNDPLRHAKRTMGKAQVTVFRNDLAGEAQYELIVPRDQMVELWHLLHEAGDGHGEANEGGINLRAIGWSAFNTARIEAGSPLYGIDITDHYLPMETGPWYLRAVSVTKGCYLGQEIVARMHAHSTARGCCGLRIAGERNCRWRRDGRATGMVTGYCFSPMLGNVPVAMGYVKKSVFDWWRRKWKCLAEGGRAKGTVSELPLWKRAKFRYKSVCACGPKEWTNGTTCRDVGADCVGVDGAGVGGGGFGHRARGMRGRRASTKFMQDFVEQQHVPGRAGGDAEGGSWSEQVGVRVGGRRRSGRCEPTSLFLASPASASRSRRRP